MKLNGKQIRTIKQSILFCFIVLFSMNFMYQRIVDNEVNCGLLGSPESGCPYAFLDHTFGIDPGHDLGEEGEHADHVCISCPCNSIVAVTWNLYLSHILIQLHKIYFEPKEIQIPKFVLTNYLFRPPKEYLT
ncbi:MAG: hypothetical protein ACO1NV_11885 [Leptospira bouyouniensis]|uniref:DUF2946 domain-containing protein n=1 Tax=Leptospira bouyouniensis TaxID=2484911 RepID=A0A7I0HWJ3_9LEPT|nr:hypothetical protein [Leptospira bouyouniensis]TGL08635.1 hypothetical protein EHQ43_04815 [Leptospira bouyouniensis]